MGRVDWFRNVRDGVLYGVDIESVLKLEKVGLAVIPMSLCFLLYRQYPMYLNSSISQGILFGTLLRSSSISITMSYLVMKKRQGHF